jgi:hypothetical protein
MNQYQDTTPVAGGSPSDHYRAGGRNVPTDHAVMRVYAYVTFVVGSLLLLMAFDLPGILIICAVVILAAMRISMTKLRGKQLTRSLRWGAVGILLCTFAGASTTVGWMDLPVHILGWDVPLVGKFLVLLIAGGFYFFSWTVMTRLGRVERHLWAGEEPTPSAPPLERLTKDTSTLKLTSGDKTEVVTTGTRWVAEDVTGQRFDVDARWPEFDVLIDTKSGQHVVRFHESMLIDFIIHGKDGLSRRNMTGGGQLIGERPHTTQLTPTIWKTTLQRFKDRGWTYTDARGEHHWAPDYQPEKLVEMITTQMPKEGS